MPKDYEGWFQHKLYLETKVTPPFFYEREIWWAAIGCNLGFEEDGKGAKYARPVLVLRKFNKHLFWGIPLTSVKRQGKYYADLRYSNRSDTVLLSQLKAFDSKRLLDLIGKVDALDFARVQLGLVTILRQGPQK